MVQIDILFADAVDDGALIQEGAGHDMYTIGVEKRPLCTRLLTDDDDEGKDRKEDIQKHHANFSASPISFRRSSKA